MRSMAWSCCSRTAWPRWPGTATGTWSCTSASRGSGRVLHTINPRLHPDQIAWIANHAEDQVLCFDATFLPLVQAIHAKCPGIRQYVMLCDSGKLPAGHRRPEPGGLRGLDRRPAHHLRLAQLRRELGLEHVLHERHHRQPQGRALQPPLDAAACVRGGAARRDGHCRRATRCCRWCRCSTSMRGASRTRPRSPAASWCSPARRWTASRSTN